MRLFQRLDFLSFCVLTVLTVGLVVTAAIDSRTPTVAAASYSDSSGPIKAPGPITAFIGDSYTGGSLMGGNAQNNYSQILGKRYGWRVANTALGGSGYIVGGPSGKAFELGQLDRVVKVRPSLVMVFGSRNDSGQAGIEAAAAHLYAGLKSRLPGVRIVVIGVPWINANPPSDVRQNNEAIKAAASQSQLPFIDPIAEDWFAGPREAFIGVDGVHPTDGGHVYMADMIERDLVRIGISP